MKKGKLFLLLIPILLSSCKSSTPKAEVNYGESKKTYYYYTKVDKLYIHCTVEYSKDFKTIISNNIDDEGWTKIVLNDDYNMLEESEYSGADESSIMYKNIWTYDNNGYLLKESDYLYEDGIELLYCEDTYKYDNEGRETEYARYWSYDKEKPIQLDYIYEYRYEDNEVYEIQYDYVNSKKVFDYGEKRVTVINEKANTKVESIYEILDENITQFKLLDVITYDLTTGKELRFDYFEGDNIPCAFVYTYNNFGDMVSCVNTGSVLTRINEYEYDEKGHITKSKYRVFNNETQHIYNNSEETYVTDDNGVVTYIDRKYYEEGVLKSEQISSFEAVGAKYYLPFLYDFFAMQPGNYTI